MTNEPSIPRALVAEALAVDADTLPAGDLPFDRFAARYLAYVAAGNDDAPPPADHPDAWAFALLVDLTASHPALALAVIRALLAAATQPEEVAVIAGGPLEDLLHSHGPDLLPDIETAAQAPRFAYALSGVWPPENGPALFWARIQALTTSPGLDDGAPLPAATGL